MSESRAAFEAEHPDHANAGMQYYHDKAWSAWQLAWQASRKSMRAELEAALQDRVALAAENERLRGEVAVLRKDGA